jgi:Tfp pilus assembly protein FimT
LTLVMLIVSILLALSAPQLHGFFGSRQTADAATNVLSLARWARNDAISNGRTCRLNVDAANATYWLTVQGRDGQFARWGSDVGRTFQLPEGASLTLTNESRDSSQPYVEFSPTGRCDVAAIAITGKGGEVVQVKAASAAETFRIVTNTEGAQ